MDRRKASLVGAILTMAVIITALGLKTTVHEPFRPLEIRQDGEFCEQYQAQCICVSHST